MTEFLLSLRDSFFARSGRVTSWEVQINSEWFHQRALVDEGEIIGEIDTFKYEGPPPEGRRQGLVIKQGKKQFLVEK